MPDESLNKVFLSNSQNTGYSANLDFIYNDPSKETKVITTLSKNIEPELDRN